MRKILSDDMVKVCNYVLAALMLVLLVLQFTPFWQYGEAGEQSASIGEYIWFPTENGALEAHLQEATANPDFTVEQILAMPLILLAGCVGGIILAVLKGKSPFCAIVPCICGAAGIWGYLSQAAFRLGINWGLHLALSIGLFAIGLFVLIAGFQKAEISENRQKNA